MKIIKLLKKRDNIEFHSVKNNKLKKKIIIVQIKMYLKNTYLSYFFHVN